MFEKELPMINDFERTEPMALQVEVVKLADKLNFGEGTISVEDRIDDEHQHTIDPATLQNVEDAIHSDKILVAIGEEDGSLIDDDGCSDGRVWGKVFKKVGDNVEHLKRSLNRYKVFGGGATMAIAADIGAGETKGLTLKNAFRKGIESLKSVGLPFGAHTDSHARDENCGCGAIDKAPANIQNTVTYRSEIETAIGLLTPDTEGLDEVLDNYAAYAGEIADQSYAGREVMDTIIDNGKIVKELDGPHLEVAIVISTVEGFTVNQDHIRDISDGKAQVFAVDVPRLTQIAEKLHKNDPARQRQAFLSMLVYTLGTSATLTKGDLPVYIVSGKPVEAIAA